MPKFLHTLARFIYRTLTIVALASAPVGTYYAFVAAREAVDGNPLQGRMVQNGDLLVSLTEDALAQRRDELDLNRGMLAALNRILPEAEKAAIGIDRLVNQNEQQRTAVQTEQAKRRAAPARAKSGPEVATNDTSANGVAERIWSELRRRTGDQ